MTAMPSRGVVAVPRKRVPPAPLSSPAKTAIILPRTRVLGGALRAKPLASPDNRKGHRPLHAAQSKTIVAPRRLFTPASASLAIPVHGQRSKDHSDTRTVAKPTCKERPSSSRGPGGSRAFIPWCRK